MKLPHRKSQMQRLLDTVNDSLDALKPSTSKSRPTSKIKAHLPGAGSGGALPAALSKDKAMKAGLVAGSLAGLTAASAGISTLRRPGRARKGQ